MVLVLNIQQTLPQTGFGRFYKVSRKSVQTRSPCPSNQIRPDLQWGSTGKLQPWDLQVGKIRANSCCLLRRAPTSEALKELPGVSCMTSVCLKQQPQCKCVCRPVWPKEPSRPFQIQNYSLRLQQDFSNACYFKYALSVDQHDKTVTAWHLTHDWFVTEVAEWPSALLGSVFPSPLPWRKGEHISPDRHGFIVHILLIIQISDNQCTHVYTHFFSMSVVTLKFYTHTEKQQSHRNAAQKNKRVSQKSRQAVI